MRLIGSAMLASVLSIGLPALSAATEAPRVLPVLSQESGQVEALLLLDDSGPAGPASALDRLLDASARQSGLQVSLGSSRQIRSQLTLDAEPGLALLCRGNIGLAAALGSLADQCLLADVGASDPLFGPASAKMLGIESDWQSADGEFDVRFGLAWLDGAVVDPIVGGSLFAVSADGSTALAPLGLAPLQIDSRQFSLSGTRRLGDSGWLRIIGNTSRNSSNSLFGAPLRWETRSLSVEGGFGSLSGRLTGRLIELPRLDASAPQTSFDVDLGVSWRTPWRAQLTVGARNVLGQPDASAWPLSSLPQAAEAETRTPYVRYRQDL